MDSADIHQQQKQLEEEGALAPESSAGKKQVADAEQLLDMPSEEDEEEPPPPTKKNPAATLAQGQAANMSGSEAATQPLRPSSMQARDCTYTAISNFRLTERVAPNLMGGDLLSAGDCGSFYCDSDNRQQLCFTLFDFGEKQNIMFSYNPKTWECNCCPGRVLYKRGQAHNIEPRTFILSDQNFPAILPSKSSAGLQCLKIIRIEFASLWELCNKFIDLVKKDDLAIPTGSTILLGSASHLSNVGLSAYAEDLAAVYRRLLSFLDGGIYCLPCPFILCGGTNDVELIRSTAELVSWLGNILGKEVYYTPVALDLSARRILESKFPVTQTTTRRFMLPTALSSNQKKKWACGPASLPARAGPAGTEVEEEIINTLLKELNSRLALNLDTVVSFDRFPALPQPKPGRYVVVGASHAGRTADALAASGASVVKLTVPGWRITKAKVAEMADRLMDTLQQEGPDCSVVFEMFDSNSYLARTEEGGLVPICKRLLSGEYHVDGDLVFAPKELQYSTFCDAKPLLEVAGNRKKIVVTPIPRYLLQSCCTDADHISNMREPDYRLNLETAVIDSRKFMKDFCFRQGLRNIRVVGPWPALRALGDSVWKDQVHMVETGYNTVANLVVEAVAELAEKPEAGASNPRKRPHDDEGPSGTWGRRPGPPFKNNPSWPRYGRRRY